MNKNIKPLDDELGTDYSIELENKLKGCKNKFVLAKAEKYLINNAIKKGLDIDSLADSMIKYEDLLTRGKKTHTLKSYISAVEFVSYVVSGLSYTEAWSKTFPKKAMGTRENMRNIKASQYCAGSLVSSILGRVYLNQHIFFIDKTIQAKIELYNMGLDPNMNGRDRVNALDKFLVHTSKYEENANKALNQNVNNTVNIITSIENKLNSLANVAKKEIEDGSIDAKALAGSIIDIKSSDE